MKLLPLVFSATLLALGGSAHAANREVSAYLDKASAVATAQLSAAGVTTDRGMTLRARVASDGRLSNVHVISTASAFEDNRRAELALRRLRVLSPPASLIGANVEIAVGGDPVRQAKLP